MCMRDQPLKVYYLIHGFLIDPMDLVIRCLSTNKGLWRARNNYWGKKRNKVVKHCLLIVKLMMLTFQIL